MKYHTFRRFNHPNNITKIGQFLLLLGFIFFLILLIGILVYYTTGRSPNKFVWKTNIVHLWESGDYEHVLVLSENILSRDPLDAHALFFSGAASYYLLAFGTAPEDHYYYLNQAILNLQIYLNLKKSLPYAAEAYYILGKVYYNKGYSYAHLVIENLQKSISLGYDNTDISEYMGMAYILKGEYEVGIQHLEKVSSPKNDYSLSYNIAKAYALAKQYEKSYAIYLDIYENSRNDHLRDQAYFQISSIHYERGQYEEAKNIVQKFLQKYPSHADARFILAEIYFLENNNHAARKEWEIVTRLDPLNTKALNRLHGGISLDIL